MLSNCPKIIEAFRGGHTVQKTLTSSNEQEREISHRTSFM